MDKKNISLFTLFKTFFSIGIITWGGGMAMISILEEDLVHKKKWVTDDEYVDIIALCQLLPGIIAINMSCIIGYKFKRKLGALVSAFGVVLPSFVIIYILSSFINDSLYNETVSKIFTGITITVGVFITKAAITIGLKSIKDYYQFFLLVICVILNSVFRISAIYIIIGAVIVTFIYTWLIRKGVKENA